MISVTVAAALCRRAAEDRFGDFGLCPQEACR